MTHEKILRKLSKLGRTLIDTVMYCPDENVINLIRNDCKQTFAGAGRINFSYARQIAIARDYAQAAHNTQTNKTLMEDIESGQRIFLSNYIK